MDDDSDKANIHREYEVNEQIELHHKNATEETQKMKVDCYQTKPKYIVSSNDENKYDCLQCDYKATTTSHLKTHVQAKHEGMKFPCSYCNFKATQASNLKTHIKSKHLGIKFPCTQCDYKGATSSNLNAHVKTKH